MSIYKDPVKNVYKTGNVYSGPDIYTKWDGGDDVIGGRKYRTVKIGSQIWLAENLDFKWPGLTVGGTGVPSTPAAWYYDNNEALWGIDAPRKCGLLYNGFAVQYLETNKASLCPGWHVPSRTEWNTLFTAVGGVSTAAKQLKAKDVSWATLWNGLDSFDFTVFPAGSYYGTFYDAVYYAYMWTKDQSGSNLYYKLFQGTDNVTEQSFNKLRGMSIRLVHD